MRNKKIISWLLSICIALSAVTVGILSISAATQPTVYADSVYANNGEMVVVYVQIKNNTGLAGAKLQFTYDETKLTPVFVQPDEVFSSGLQDNIEGDAQPGSFNVYWASATGDNVYDDGILFCIIFNALETTHGSTKLGISYDSSDTFDENFNDVSLICADVIIPVYDPSVSTYIETNLFLANQSSLVRSENFAPGEEFSLQGNYNIYGFSGPVDSITYQVIKASFDSSAIEFIGFEMEDGSFLDTIDGVEIYPDSVIYVGDFGNVGGVSSGRFKIKENAQPGDYKITFSVEELGGLEVDAKYNNPFVASVSLSDSQEKTNVYIPAGIVAEKGQSVTVPVMINNNQGIMGYRLSFTYNTSDLQIVSVSNGEEFYGNISDSIGNEDGSFDVVWNSTENKTSNSTLLYLNFDVVSTTVDQAVESQIQINYTSGDTFNENYEDVELNCTNGTVLICPGHTYTKSVVNPNCTEKGYSTFECNYCSTQYFDEYTEPIGHYYVYQGNKSFINNIANTMEYKCKDCDEMYSSNCNDVFNIWSNNTDKYINSKPSRNDLNSQLLDVNNDNFINAKDYAMIYHAHKTK